MDEAQPQTKPERVRNVERSLQVEVKGLGGFELRPTRLFVWGGEERQGAERVLPLGSAPRSLTIPRRRRERQAGAVELTTLGNPVLTIALAGVHAVKALGRRLDSPLLADPPTSGRPAPGPAGSAPAAPPATGCGCGRPG